MTRKTTITVLILALVGGIAAWSKLRFVEGERYDAPQRWRVEDYPMPGTRADAHPGAHASNQAGLASGS